MHEAPSADAGSPAPVDRRLDGNALAGPLGAVFAVDLTSAIATCGTCSQAAPIAESMLFVDAPAYVLRCRGCAGVLLRYGQLGQRWHLDLSGTSLLVGYAP